MNDDELLKKLKTESKSHISFWSDSNKDTFEVEIPIADSEFSFTSAEISDQSNMKTSNNNKISNIKFIIRDIIKTQDTTKLYGDDVICNIRGEWRTINFEINTKLTVMTCLCCDKDLSKEYKDGFIIVEVDDETNYLFIEDDLMTITNFVSSIRCINNPYLSSKVADINFNFSDKCLVNGIILHEIMEECIINDNYKLSFIINKMNESIKENIVNIYICDSDEKTVRNDCMMITKNIISFTSTNDYKFEESEKQVSSLLMNLKGNCDAVGQNVVLEIKSGKYLDVSHKAQVLLYSLLLREKYKKTFFPCLFYISGNNFLNLTLRHSEIKSLMILRNKLTLINEIEDCSCSEFESCRILQKISKFRDTHWLKKMYLSINQEEKYRQKETWHLVKFKKQEDMTVVFINNDIPVEDVFINIYTVDLVKICKGIISKVDLYLYVSLSENINLEKDRDYYISFGNNDIFFKYMRWSLINIAYFKYINKSETSHGFQLPDEDIENEGLLDFSIDDIEVTEIKGNNTKINLKDDINIKDSLDDAIHSSLDRQISQTIKSNTTSTGSTENMPSSALSDTSSFVYFTPLPEIPRFKYKIPEIYLSQFLSLNNDQKSALYSALHCENYKIVHGMPGTGKSSVIVLLIKILVYLNKKVLLVCYTNLALTNILDKLKTIRSYRAKKESCNFSSVSDLKRYFKNIDLVASTCFGFRDPIFLNRSFDFCIIDEGSQQHLLLTLIPISLCTRFIIFGDHLQLKPLSKSNSLLSLSLFEYLLDSDHSELTIQYRMGPNIMRLSNELFYNNKLKLSTEKMKTEDTVSFVDSNTINYNKFITRVKDSTILCYFNSQVKKTRDLTKCQVETVDRFQGSEADNIIVVFDPIVKCGVLESRERLNVALTRARKNLILVGDINKMKDIQILQDLLAIMNID
ncbi:DNA replication ATP-dependent helicase/nuclease DNA2 [Vairimorpha necatrix]|uniref:DNA replication ATP-dependent helicase/nuclease n=1 Tax=Vairimorpha necatrix TaxID=6039 RepID=A0AAX4JDF8_9MICR